MLIAVSGTQGSGKSTTINGLQNIGYKVIEKKSSRTILKEMNKSLDEINRNKVLVKEFQDRVLDLHYNTDKQYFNSEEIFIRERSYSDIFVYACLQLAQYNEFDSWINEYYQKCKTYQQEMYSAVILLNSKVARAIENDGVRSINQHFGDIVRVLLENYTYNFSDISSKSLNVYINRARPQIIDVKEDDKEKRIAYIDYDINFLIESNLL